MDKLAQIAALSANPDFELAPSVPYRQVRAIWALWRIRQDLRLADRRVFMLRAALPCAAALLLFLSAMIAFNIGIFLTIFAVIISSLVFLNLLYLAYWILAPAEIYEFQKRLIQEQSYKSAADQDGAFREESGKRDYHDDQAAKSEEQTLYRLRGIFAER